MAGGGEEEPTAGPVVDALTAIAVAANRNVLPRNQLGDWYNKSDHDLTVFSYAHDFESLWGLNEGMDGLVEIVNGLAESRQNNNELTILIAWGGMPQSVEEMVAVGSYVTPYDWAIALSVALYSQQRKRSHLHPQLRVLVLDTASHKTGASFIQHSFFAFHNLFPWVQDYRPVAVGADDWAKEALKNLNDHVEYAFLRQAVSPRGSDIYRLIEDLIYPDRVLTTFDDFDDATERGKNLEILIQAWQKEFMKAGIRHSIANLAGPLVMADGFVEPLRSMARNVVAKNNECRLALIEVLRTVQLMTKPQDMGFSIDGPIGPSEPFRHGKLRILLIDDQHKEGFQHIVGFVLFGDKYISSQCHDNKISYGSVTLRSEGSADSILTIFENREGCTDWDWPRQLPIEADILLLDLRLWLDTESVKRQEFFNRLIGVCDQLGIDALVQRDRELSKALHAAREIGEKGIGGEIEALALLPLLLSYYDPAFPIVLFSSTHQRQLVRMLTHRKNIITDFSKPLDTGYGQGVAAFTAIQDLRQAIERAVRLYETRTVWRHLTELTPETMRMPEIPRPDGNGKMNATPGINKRDLINSLARIYEYYIVGQRYYDFLSMPWEFLEAALSPVSLNNESNYRFKVIGGGVSQLGLALRQCRHKKAHGSFLSNELIRREVWTPDIQTCSVLQFLFLISVLSPQQNTFPKWLYQVDRHFGKLLVKKYKKLTKAVVETLLMSEGALKVVNGGEYVFLALLTGASRNGSSLSKRTLEILEKVKEELFSEMRV